MHPRNTKKALIPTASTGILVCIAVAVSLATVAWMNGLPTPDIQTENLQVTNHQLAENHAYFDVALHNNGTQAVKIASVTVNSQPTTVAYITGSNQINTGETAVIRVANAFTPNQTYQLTFQTTKGTKITHTITT